MNKERQQPLLKFLYLVCDTITSFGRIWYYDRYLVLQMSLVCALVLGSLKIAQKMQSQFTGNLQMITVDLKFYATHLKYEKAAKRYWFYE